VSEDRVRPDVHDSAACRLVAVEVRLAKSGEGVSLGAIHVRAWIDTYSRAVPDNIVAERLPRVRELDWEELMRRRRRTAGAGVLALVEDGQLVGLCEFGPTEDGDDDPRVAGHVFRLFINPSHQSAGGGRLLLATARDHLLAVEMKEATLWVLESDERARGFYEHLGWQPDGARQGEAVADIRYRLTLA
jgi:GNAT superfamily N-acetyltransferase